jgi:DNA polymerase-3 subunit beta
MKFSVKQSVFLNALQIVSKAVPQRPTHPVLANIRTEANQDEIILTGFDLSFGIEVKITEFNFYEQGVICLPAKLLLNIVSKQGNNSEIIVSSDENNQCTFSCDNSEYQISGMDTDEYPELSSVVDDSSEQNDNDFQEFILSPSDLLTAIKSTVFACATDESKQVLTGLNFDISDCLKVAATDGHRLSVISIANDDLKLEPKDKEVNITIPSKILKELERILSDKRLDSIKLIKGNGNLSFQTESTKFVSRTLSGEYPKYQNLIPDDNKFSTSITVDRKALIKSIDKVSAILDNPKSDLIEINLNPDDQQIRLSTQTKDVGECFETLFAQISGELEMICFNVSYFLDALKAIESNEVQIKLIDKTNPCIIIPLSNLEMLCLIMPVQQRR